MLKLGGLSFGAGNAESQTWLPARVGVDIVLGTRWYNDLLIWGANGHGNTGGRGMEKSGLSKDTALCTPIRNVALSSTQSPIKGKAKCSLNMCQLLFVQFAINCDVIEH
eukprot:scaffold14767_cov28-Attheya_sp.AAC.1